MLSVSKSSSVCYFIVDMIMGIGEFSEIKSRRTKKIPYVQGYHISNNALYPLCR